MKRELLNMSILGTHFQNGGGTLNHTGGTYSLWNDGLSEISDFGIVSGKFSYLCGISKLESQLQD